ncbi:MAG TPA: serine/threonine-protein kinase [Mycobacterium sp.]|nr:serine/threonine-protein kinase [Mycobacterium sp.]
MADLDSLAGRTLGAFVLGARLDEGGFGAVYAARQPLLDRDVVVKVIEPRDADDVSALERFRREALLAARLEHHYAARVYDAGIDGQLLWIAMERIRGVTLADHLAKHGRMLLDQFVPLFERIAEAVHAAHALGIVHRDLKPANIMVIDTPRGLVPKLLDLGIAKLAGDAAPDWPAGSGTGHSNSRLTPAGFTIGSPPYMAPEQWSDPSAVGPEADLYALGVIAYEALTGHPPYDVDTPEALATLHLHAPIPRVGDPGVDRVIARALAKRAADRWRSALDMAAALRGEIDAHLAGRLRTAAQQWNGRGRTRAMLWRDEVLAEAELWAERSGRAVLSVVEIEFLDASRGAADDAAESAASRRRWFRRLAIAVGVTVVVGAAAIQHSRTQLRADALEEEAQLAQQYAAQVARAAELEQGRQALLHGELADARQHLGAAWRAGDRSPGTAFMLGRARQPLAAERARLAATSGRAWLAAYSPDGRRLATTDDAGAEIWDAATHGLQVRIRSDHPVFAAAWLGGERLATVSSDAVRVWDATTGASVRQMAAPRLDGRALAYYRLAVSGDRIAALDGDGDEVHIWSVATGTVLARLPLGPGQSYPAIAFSADGRWLAATGGTDAQIWSTSSWRLAQILRADRIRGFAWSPGVPRLALGTADGMLEVVEPAGPARVLRYAGDGVSALAWSPDGTRIAIGFDDGAEHVLDAATGRVTARARYLAGAVAPIVWRPDGEAIAASTPIGAIAVATADLGLPIAVIDGAAAPRRITWRPDGGELAVATTDGQTRLWDPGAPYLRWRTAAAAPDGCGILGGAAPDGRIVAVPCRGAPTRVYDTTTGALLAELPAAEPLTGDVALALPVVSATGDRAAIARGAAAEVYDLPGGRRLAAQTHAAPVTALAFAGGDLASGDAAGGLMLGDRPLPPSRAAVDAIGVTADGRIVVVDAERRLRILAADGAPIADLEMPVRARALRFSADGRRIVSVAARAAAPAPPTLWALDPPRIMATLGAQPGEVIGVRFTARGVLTSGANGAIQLWDAEHGRPLQAYPGARRLLDADAAGDLVIGASDDGSVRFWDASSARLLWTLPTHTAAVVGVRLDGNSLITRGFSGDVARWTWPRACGETGVPGQVSCDTVQP